MSDVDFKSSGVPEVTRYEHDRKNVGAKKASVFGYDPSTDELKRITAFDNGDGTYGLVVTTIDTPLAIRQDDTTTANVIYVGKAPVGSSTAGSVWQIHKIDNTSGSIITWADGDSNFDNVWNNRASLTYS